jgi:anti-sigma-K factor RskA
MRYDDARLLDALAREYVLGTLHGRARERFARVLAASLTARRAVLAWESSLQPLALAVPGVAPPAHVWPRVAAAVGAPRERSTFGVGLWQALAASLAVVAVTFGWLFFSGGVADRFGDYVAFVGDQGAPIWLLEVYERERELSVVTINERPEPAGNSYELWMLPGGGAPPVSLGLIPGVGNAVLPLSAAQLGVLSQTMTLAVSLEPAGGSPTGLPTGPVIFTAPLLGV